ncbi:MAG: sigma-70 family RNA polymerase sigma factor [Defluviitaleaceae bacterium]|nr:sigma-70 family RNA polymerase sigma factor [Defluviitaleaceae bacterium]
MKALDGELRSSLVKLLRYKFAKYPNVVSLTEDIVHDAYLNLKNGKHYAPDKVNYGYLSVVCVRMAYRKFMEQSVNLNQVYLDAEGTSLLDETDIIEEILQAEDTYAVLESLKVLRDIERVVITQRYYGDFSFAEIAKANGLKLNTVLSHHRRALGKLRPQLTKLLDFRKDESYE